MIEALEEALSRTNDAEYRGSGCVAAALLISGASRATQLITEEEAKLPPPKGAVAADRRGILRGPKVEFVSPGDAVALAVQLQLKFEVFRRREDRSGTRSR